MKCLTIKDLPESKELDRKAMAMVRGGFFGLAHSTVGATTVGAIDAIGKALQAAASKQ